LLAMPLLSVNKWPRSPIGPQRTFTDGATCVSLRWASRRLGQKEEEEKAASKDRNLTNIELALFCFWSGEQTSCKLAKHPTNDPLSGSGRMPRSGRPSVCVLNYSKKDDCRKWLGMTAVLYFM